MMLNWLSATRHAPHFRDAASRIRAAYDRALADGAVTRDLGGQYGTMEFADELVRRL